MKNKDTEIFRIDTVESDQSKARSEEDLKVEDPTPERAVAILKNTAPEGAPSGATEGDEPTKEVRHGEPKNH